MKGLMHAPKIVTLMNHALTKNTFTFLDKHYLQVYGTAMGTRMAPSMACLFMGKLEERKPWIWWRYIDDRVHLDQ